MHIALVSRWYPPHTGYGGVAAYTYYLAHALADLGHRVTVVAARWSADVPARTDDGPIAVHRILASYTSWPQRLPLVGGYVRPARQLHYSLQVDGKLRELERTNRLDVVEFAEVEAEGWAYLHRRSRLRAIVRCHTPTFVLRRYYTDREAPFNTSITAAMEKYCIRTADALTAPSEDMAHTIAAACGIDRARFTVIPNALDVGRFAGCADGQTAADDLTILHVGRLERVKGLQVLCEAIPHTLRAVPHANFVFIGDDRPDGAGSTWRRRLEAFAQAHGIAEQVRFLGSVSQEELAEWYRRADIAAVPSMLYESFSYTCAQAMAAGLPVVASDVGGISETLGDCGLLVPPSDPDALAAALIRLAREPALRQALGQRARQRARQRFDATIVAQQIAGVYQRAVPPR